ncbi:hypothetical protein [Streptomyces pseudovenezuelae]|uniref:hypothetical protein n=1 Tax=Streptomyces pseudovenezuelae TaxID=67350 RepID=UPI00099D42A2|nr:hypothetical protein [Streptomyces pseudovenezuelae]
MAGTDEITQTQLDANALAVLDTLREEGSATGATARLRINAPAMSRSLGPRPARDRDQMLCVPVTPRPQRPSERRAPDIHAPLLSECF